MAGDAHGGSHGGGHIMPVYMLVFTFAALIILTILTVLVTRVDLGGTLNLSIALIIATVKAALVCLYFMHLRYDRPFNSIILGACVLFVILFLGLSTIDTEQYRDEIHWRQVELSRGP
ncbi:MAG: cytochrome C oxidase subunit IV family protein [Phycisphaerae bacterium]|nr:cytochrome C oxidase subunit IV family protein [Phycisphaerae bacterium]MCZ2400495.1 cytochrome C oxidase subunit IV family protein [Phycisphaerae bacterium]